ncbi:MAG: hypothetical protein AMXMBFR76_19480 [Pseudomonadota bacterium]
MGRQYGQGVTAAQATPEQRKVIGIETAPASTSLTPRKAQLSRDDRLLHEADLMPALSGDIAHEQRQRAGDTAPITLRVSVCNDQKGSVRTRAGHERRRGCHKTRRRGLIPEPINHHPPCRRPCLHWSTPPAVTE